MDGLPQIFLAVPSASMLICLFIFEFFLFVAKGKVSHLHQLAPNCIFSPKHHKDADAHIHMSSY